LIAEAHSQLPANLVSPLNGNQCISNVATLDWDVLQGNVRYRVVVADNPQLTSAIVDTNDITSANTEYQFFAPDSLTDYYWMVEAEYRGSSSLFVQSDTFMFSTVRGPLEITFPAPATICADTNITFTFDTIPDAVEYVIQISENQFFSTLEYDVDSLVSPTFTADLEKSDFTYYYRAAYTYVQDTFVCQSDWTEVTTLRTRYEAPVLSSPQDSSVGVPQTFMLEWNDEPNATGYDFQIDDEIDFSSPEIDSTSDLNSIQLTLADTNSVYYARLRAKDDLCQSAWSETVMFRTAYQTPTIISPQDSVDCVEIESMYEWSGNSDALSYTIQFSEDEIFLPIALEINNIDSTNILAELPGSLDEYFWRVRAEDSINRSEWSGIQQLRTTIFPPEMLEPNDGQQGVLLSTDFSWDTFDPISRFVIQVSTSRQFPEEDLIYHDTTILKNANIILPDYNTTYYWRMLSDFSECSSGWAETFSFRTVRGFPDLTSPADDTTNIIPITPLRWSEVEGAEFYDLELSESDQFVQGSTRQAYGLTNRGYSFNNMEEDTEYFWRVRSRNEYGISDWSEVSSFTTGKFPPDQVRLLGPSNASTDLDTMITFVWSKVDDISLYDFQLSENENFNSIVEDANDLTDTTFTVSGLSNMTTYYWRVRSKNQTNILPWPMAFRFTTIDKIVDEAPELLAPTDGQENVSLIAEPFSWSEVPRADSYNIQISEDSAFPDDNLFFNREKISSTSLSVFGLEGITTYYWRVQAQNAAGKGPWSDPNSFITFDPTSVSQISASRFKVVPNPARERVDITFDHGLSLPYGVQIIDRSGRMIQITDFMFSGGTLSIDLGKYRLSNGSYDIVIIGSDFSTVLQLVISD
jgi:hypothetical protein